MDNSLHTEPKIHSTADVQSSDIGFGTVVWQNVVILPKAKIGTDCNINCLCFIENDVVIGDRVTLKPGVYLWDGILIESDVFIGPNVSFTNDKYPKSKTPPTSFDKIIVKTGASIGAGAVIIGPCEIGEKAMIGAGAVVTKSVKPGSIMIGNPAKQKE
jgi:UDP-2-acetamido-3-amino-2,3-dideoxy-glucuronate N-acetyltransferase